MVSFVRCTSCHMARRLMSTNPARLETDRKHMDVSYPRPICVTQHLVVFTVRWRQQQCKGGEQERCPELGWKRRLCFPLPLAQSRQQKTLVFMTACEGRICRTSSTKNRKGSDAETALAVARTTVQNAVKWILTYDQHIYFPPHSAISCSLLSPVGFNAVKNSHGLTFSPLLIFFVWIFISKLFDSFVLFDCVSNIRWLNPLRLPLLFTLIKIKPAAKPSERWRTAETDMLFTLS